MGGFAGIKSTDSHFSALVFFNKWFESNTRETAGNEMIETNQAGCEKGELRDVRANCKVQKERKGWRKDNHHPLPQHPEGES